MKGLGKIEFRGEKLLVLQGNYADDNIAIQLVTKDGEPYMTASVNVDGLKKGEVAIKDYSENKGIYDALVSAKLITEWHRLHFQGFVEIPICRLMQRRKKNESH